MKIATIKGIDIKLHYSTIVIMLLVGYSSAVTYMGQYSNISTLEAFLFGICSGLLVLFSILIHELMHSLTSGKLGLKVSEIEFYIFGGVSKITDEPKSPGVEFKIAVVGPMTSLVFGGILFLLFYLPISLPRFLDFLAFYIGQLNLILGIFNLIPAFPMDGGRLLRAFLWGRRHNLVSATRTAAKAGSYFGIGMIILGVLAILFALNWGGLWYILMGNFLNNAAKNSIAQTIIFDKLEKLHAHHIMHPLPPAIPYEASLDAAIREYFMRFKHDAFPVEVDGKFIGILAYEHFFHLLPEQRLRMMVKDVMMLAEKFPSVTIHDTGKKALMTLEMSTNPIKILIVKDENGMPINFIREHDFQETLSYAQFIEGEIKTDYPGK